PWITDLDDTPVGQPVRTIVRHVVPAASWVEPAVNVHVVLCVPAEAVIGLRTNIVACPLREVHRLAVHPDEDYVVIPCQADPQALAGSQAVLPVVPREVLLSLVVDRRQVAAERKPLGRTPRGRVLTGHTSRVTGIVGCVSHA